MLSLKRSSARQKVGITFFAASGISGVALSYLWAWYLATPGRDFPSRWAIFEFSLNIWAVVVVITTVIFVLPLCIQKRFSDSKLSVRNYSFTVFLAAAVQSGIFAAPHISSKFNPILLALVVLPALASWLFALLSRPSQMNCNPRGEPPAVN